MAVVGLLLAAITGGYAQAQARLPNISIAGRFDQPKAIADGKSSMVLNVRLTENGQPRADALLQACLESGGGLFIPEWTHTDEDGRAEMAGLFSSSCTSRQRFSRNALPILGRNHFHRAIASEFGQGNCRSWLTRQVMTNRVRWQMFEK